MAHLKASWSRVENEPAPGQPASYNRALKFNLFAIFSEILYALKIEFDKHLGREWSENYSTLSFKIQKPCDTLDIFKVNMPFLYNIWFVLLKQEHANNTIFYGGKKQLSLHMFFAAFVCACPYSAVVNYLINYHYVGNVIDFQLYMRMVNR